ISLCIPHVKRVCEIFLTLLCRRTCNPPAAFCVKIGESTFEHTASGGGTGGGTGAAPPHGAGGHGGPGGGHGQTHGLYLRPGGLRPAGIPPGRGGGGVRRLPGPVG